MQQRLEYIINEMKRYLAYVDEDKIRRAYEFALDIHGDQKRFSGEPYILHPLEACKILLRVMPDVDTICACILHDTVEDDRLKRDQELLETIRKEFGDDVAKIVDGVSKLGRVRYTGKERELESLRKMFVAMAEDLRVILVRLADRLHNMQTLRYVRPDKQERIARETLEVYVTVAARIGVYAIKKDLEDECFRYLYPEEYKTITDALDKEKLNYERQIKLGEKRLQKLMRQHNITADVTGRFKNPYSIYKKMKKKGLTTLAQVMDIFALRIVVDEIETCYAVLGYLHAAYTPLPNRFNDYIANPKPNGYQSLHTDVMGLLDKATEVQIRTPEMHRSAEFGLAAHWNYKEKANSINVPKEQRSWLDRILHLNKTDAPAEDFVKALQLDLFDDEVFVYTHTGEIRSFPEGSTPIDFAYSIHTDLGHTTKGAKVNNKIVPLDYKLRNGDTVEIISKNPAMPSQYWLKFVQTSGAREKIRSFLATQNRDKNIRLGQTLLNETLVKNHKPKLDTRYVLLDKYAGEELDETGKLEILEKIGAGNLSAVAVFNKIYPPEIKPKAKKASKKKTLNMDVVVGGQSGLVVKFASCCNPKPYKTIFAYSSVNDGISIHRKDCPYRNTLNPDRILPAYWEGAPVVLQLFRVEIHMDYTPGLLGRVMGGFYERGLEVQNVKTENSQDESILFLDVFTHNEQEIDLIRAFLEDNPHIQDFSLSPKSE